MASVSVNTSLQSEDQRLIYLMTYSRADTSRFPSRSSFSEAVLEGWENCGVRVLHWVVSLEAHADTDNSVSNEINNSYHYHMAVKLSKRKRWLQVRKFLDERYGIKVHFSDIHNTYYTAYRYVTKEDSEALHSSNHPDLQEVPRTERAIACKKSKRKLSERGKKNKKSPRKRLAVYDVTQLIQQKKIKSRLELVCLAVEQQREGKTELAEFIANRGNRVVDEALSLALEFSQAEEKFARSKKTRIEILEECQQQQCSEGCGGKWIVAAEKLLGAHGIVVNAFCNAIYTALKEGRGKYRNVYIYGPANTGKTFILSPLKKIFHAFCNPATGSFAWMGAQDAEIIFLNDFRWNPAIIAWADFLQALEGDIVHLPAPKTFCKQDIELSKDTPFFATADAPLALVKGAIIDRANTQMMEVRWRLFHFWRQIPQSEQENLVPCASCFARFILTSK